MSRLVLIVAGVSVDVRFIYTSKKTKHPFSSTKLCLESRFITVKGEKKTCQTWVYRWWHGREKWEGQSSVEDSHFHRASLVCKCFFLNCVLLGSNCLTALRLEEEYKKVVIKKSIIKKNVGTVKRRLYNIRWFLCCKIFNVWSSWFSFLSQRWVAIKFPGRQSC